MIKIKPTLTNYFKSLTLKIKALRIIVKKILSLLLPIHCHYCKTLLSSKEDNTVLCNQCIEKLESETLNKEPTCPRCSHSKTKTNCISCFEKKYLFKKNTSLLKNKALSQLLFYDYKFKQKRSHIPILTNIILKHYKQYLSNFDVYLPIVLNKKETYLREFCPVLSIVKKISKKTKVPIIKAIKKKPSAKTKQRFKSKEERENTYKDYLFIKKKKQNLINKKILIIDDIFTTGETINACSQHIRENVSCKKIESFTFLRSLVINKTESKH